MESPVPSREAASPPLGPATLALPPRPPEPAAPGFPWLAAVAPLVGAAMLWAVTGSALSLAFAALGPLVAVASMVDARRQARRARRRADAERRDRMDALRSAVEARHDAERAALGRAGPSAREIVDGPQAIEWRGRMPGLVLLGHGTVASAVRVDGVPADAADERLLLAAGALERAPVFASLDGGVGIVGPSPVVDALARALVVQVAHASRPEAVGIAVPARAAWVWATALPHADGPPAVRVVREQDGGRGSPVASDDGELATIMLARSVVELPTGLQTVVVVHDRRRAEVERPGAAAGTTVVVPDLVGLAEATAWAGRVRDAADLARAGGPAGLPERVPFDTLDQPAAAAVAEALPAVVGVARDGPLELDLVAHGPHAMVAGTTGSGKSEFLVAWLAALASCHPSGRVAFLLVDFKGGAAFEPLRGIPHVAGIVTDLDEPEAERAVASLRAELRHRERVLRDAGVRDLAALPAHAELARLVLVIDEYQAMIERFPDLGAVVADIAARGRSLGVHLVLASQRPNGVVREQVAANCAIRVSLRVRQRADSVAVVGTEAAATIRADVPGRGVVDRGDGSPVLFQSALVDRAALERLRSATAGSPPARRPWMDPLPSRLTPEELSAWAASAPGDRRPPAVLPFGLLDDPGDQRYLVAAWDPDADGPLLVVGRSGSGRSTALAAIARAAADAALEVVPVAGPASLRWDRLCEQSADDGGARPRLFLVDDLDVAFRDWPDDHRQAGFAMLEQLLREGRRRGLLVAASAVSALRLPPMLRELFGTTVLLRHATRSDLVHAGGTAALWRHDEPPGSGQWRERRLQVVDVPMVPGPGTPEVPALRFDATVVSVVVSARPRADAAALRAQGHDPVLLEPGSDAAARRAIGEAGRGAGPTILIGDADGWAANWSLTALVREQAAIVVHGGPREFRVFGGAALPPLLDDQDAQCWLTPPGGRPSRWEWPVQPDN